MSSQANPSQTSARMAQPSLLHAPKAYLHSCLANRRTHVTVLLYVVINAIGALLEQRADALTAWENWLRIHFGLILPCLCFALALDVSRSGSEPFDADTTRARYGENRRKLVLLRLLIALSLGLVVNIGTLLFCRTLTYPAQVACFNHDVLVCVGISVLATTTYITFFGAMTKVGLGRIGAVVALFVDLTLGHADGTWSFITPHRHIAEIVGNPGIFLVSAFTSSVILVAAATVATAWIAARTPR